MHQSPRLLDFLCKRIGYLGGWFYIHENWELPLHEEGARVVKCTNPITPYIIHCNATYICIILQLKEKPFRRGHLQGGSICI